MNDYEKQKYANILALLTASKYAERKQNLENVCRTFSQTNITWALSMSSALFFNGIWDDFNDLDILIDMSDISEFEKVFTQMGGQVNHETKQKEAFVSPYYKEAYFKGMHFDIVADITVKTYNTIYCYELKKRDVEYLTIEHDKNIPICPIEANFLLYAMMEGWQSRRRMKRKACELFLSETGVKYPHILNGALSGTNYNGVKYELPETIKQKVKQIMNSTINFLGRDSGFGDNNNSGYIEIENKFILIDCRIYCI